MKRPLRSVWALLALVALGAVAWAKVAGENPHWLTDADVQAIVQAEPPPPAPGSPEDAADLKLELAAQSALTPGRRAEALGDAGYSVKLFTNVIGPKITAAGEPETFRFFARLDKQVAQVVGASKDRWHRPRPYHAHAEIHSLFTAGGFSYPSGHAMHSFAFAVILGQLFPDKAEAFLERARQIAQSRVDAGVHYTSDIREGEAVGREVAKELMGKAAFRQELDAVKAELAGKS